jgi:hypothetical protein
LIVDARYPFEYVGGHIHTAENIYTDEQLRLLFDRLLASRSSCPPIIVFHCEYSSERAPRLCRRFRAFDREHHRATYPQLSFPHLFVLDGGYAEFFTSIHAERWCEPAAYISMFAKQHLHDLHRYRQAKRIGSARFHIEYYNPIPFHL